MLYICIQSGTIKKSIDETEWQKKDKASIFASFDVYVFSSFSIAKLTKDIEKEKEETVRLKQNEEKANQDISELQNR